MNTGWMTLRNHINIIKAKKLTHVSERTFLTLGSITDFLLINIVGIEDGCDDGCTPLFSMVTILKLAVCLQKSFVSASPVGDVNEVTFSTAACLMN